MSLHGIGATDAVAQIRFSNVDSLAGRIGARFGRTWSLDAEPAGGFARTITAWLRPNVWHEFCGDPLTQFSSDTGFIPFRSSLGGGWGELNVGISGQINSFTTLFANASYQQPFEGRTYAYDGKLGIRVNW
ncbi:outer membrane autotransporter protein [Bradyrhizobium sp. USDA 4532]|uniref:autotransporter domain-containing protein n=1 Tax=unclassified Bradyrhizobium TaxID=2631580 RepID=UPI0020A22754|nr:MULTISPECIES: autotransporter domain-containing protein [unclassified Bradyrhizobium]MCP1835349.1 outer membrane autotransporter protein [Bradyrhizobium sp. USDA 4545]MCP1920095.1 outer membrane autotransporter protein [Bradyrhizobium sp. USDA 4532]